MQLYAKYKNESQKYNDIKSIDKKINNLLYEKLFKNNNIKAFSNLRGYYGISIKEYHYERISL